MTLHNHKTTCLMLGVSKVVIFGRQSWEGFSMRDVIDYQKVLSSRSEEVLESSGKVLLGGYVIEGATALWCASGSVIQFNSI